MSLCEGDRQHGDALDSVVIRDKIGSRPDNKTTVLVWYDFAGGDPMFNREAYTIEEGRIRAATQTRVGGWCEGI